MDIKLNWTAENLGRVGQTRANYLFFFIQNNLDIHVNCSWITIVYQNLTKCIVISLRVNFPVSKKVLEKKKPTIYLFFNWNKCQTAYISSSVKTTRPVIIYHRPSIIFLITFFDILDPIDMFDFWRFPDHTWQVKIKILT